MSSLHKYQKPGMVYYSYHNIKKTNINLSILRNQLHFSSISCRKKKKKKTQPSINKKYKKNIYMNVYQKVKKDEIILHFIGKINI